VFAATFVLFVLACGLVALGVTSPGALNLCFSPSATQSQPGISALNVASALTACPSSDTGPAGPYDVLVVELIGMTAAALTAAVALRGIWGTATPYSIPFALTLLKLPAGAVSALLGLMLFNAALIPGLNRLATQGEILAWAAILGIGQQALTRFVDQKGQSVLNAIQGPGSNPAYPQDAAITVQDP
jgi:hypothetical protein